MSSLATSRPLLRHARLLAQQHARRQASTTEAASNAATKSKDAAKNATSKASQGLSRVTSAAGPAISGTVRGIQRRAAAVSGRAVRLISFVESLIPPTIYYSKVGWEVAKLTIQGQRMSPPSVTAFQAHFAPLLNVIRSPTNLRNFINDTARLMADSTSPMNPQNLLNTIRTTSTKNLVAAGVVGAEVLGFFTVGEMIGKFKVVGYRGDAHAGVPEH